MSNRTALISIVAIVLLAVVYFLVRSGVVTGSGEPGHAGSAAGGKPPPPPASPVVSTRRGFGIDVHRAPPGDVPVTVLGIAETTEALHSADQTVEDDLQIIQALVEQYQKIYRSVPAGGLNEEIVDRLRGENIKRLALIPPGHKSITPEGKLLDRFGNPYYFHPVSKKEIQIRSAGPDGNLWTDDDVALE